MSNSDPAHVQATLISNQGVLSLSVEQWLKAISSTPKLLITGFMQSSIESCRAGILLAEQVGAYCDPWISDVERNWRISWTREAWASCTWGEVIERADFILTWNADINDSPLTCFNQRLIADKRQVIWSIHHAETTINTLPQQALILSAEQQLLLLRQLKADAVDSSFPSNYTLWEQLQQANYPIIIWGAGWTTNDFYLSRELVQSQLRWARHASLKNRLHHISLRHNPGVMNFAAAANWLTGHSMGLSFSNLEAAADAQFFSGERLIKNREIDAICWFGPLDKTKEGEILAYGLKLYQINNCRPELENGTYLRDDYVPIYIEGNNCSLADALRNYCQESVIQK